MGESAKKMADKKQFQKIHALKNALQLSEESYRETLSYNFGVATSKAITYGQAEKLIEALEEDAVKKGTWEKYPGKSKYESLGDRHGMASPAQLRKIEVLWHIVSTAKDNKSRNKALRTFLQRRFKVSDLRWLDKGKVQKVIYVLAQMEKRKKGNK